MKRRTARLNEGLDPEKFLIYVPDDCDWIFNDYQDSEHRSGDAEGSPAERYLASLGLHPEAQQPVCPPGQVHYYPLRGSAAIEHARRVLVKLRRYLLRFKDVTSVDVGFAVKESQRRFVNTLAIRIHVRSKQPISTLTQAGLDALVSTKWATEFVVPDGQQTSDQAVRRARKRLASGPWGRWGLTVGNLASLPDPPVDLRPNARYEVPSPAADDAARVKGAGYRPEATHAYRGTPAVGGEAAQEAAARAGHPTPCCRCGRYCTCCRHECGECCRCCRHREPGGCCHDGDDYKRLTVCGVPLDVLEAKYFPAAAAGHPGGDFRDGVFVDRMVSANQISDEEALLTGRGRVSPLVGGISVGSVNGQAGTLGVVVWDETDGSPCILSNWHVLAGSARAAIEQPIYQPALFDGGTHEDVIGHLKRWHLGSLGDAAIAELDGSRYFASGEILGMWHPISGYHPPVLNLEVRKWGRTTGFTQGFIDGIYLSTNIDYGNQVVRHFDNQFHIAPLYRGQQVSEVGDSGAVVVTACHLDELFDRRLLLRGFLRKDPPDLIRGLQALLTDPKIDKASELLAGVRKLLKQYPEVVAKGMTEQQYRAHPPSRSPLLGSALEALRNLGQDDSKGEEVLADFRDLLVCILEECGIEVEPFIAQKDQKRYRREPRAYLAVGMIFAGDTPGSPFGEFALASDLEPLAKDLRISLRPIFEPRSSFRKLRSRPRRYRGSRGAGGAGGGFLGPGALGSDPRGGGPQPDPEPAQSTGPETNSPGGGSAP